MTSVGISEAFGHLPKGAPQKATSILVQFNWIMRQIGRHNFNNFSEVEMMGTIYSFVAGMCFAKHGKIDPAAIEAEKKNFLKLVMCDQS